MRPQQRRHFKSEANRSSHLMILEQLYAAAASAGGRGVSRSAALTMHQQYQPPSLPPLLPPMS
uniref:Uncharacterized protein n=1 Tax=Macrostomum lignano TaxID=282301 RepID=A0A1I8ILU8_9PLAT